MTVKPTVNLSGSANVSVKIPVKIVVGLNTKYSGQVIYLENENFKKPNEQENSDEHDTDREDDIDPNGGEDTRDEAQQRTNFMAAKQASLAILRNESLDTFYK